MSLRPFSPGLSIQGFAPPLRLRDFRLIALDLHPTLVDVDCVAEIAEAVGTRDEVAAVRDARADPGDSLRRQVALLRGATVADLERVDTEHMQPDPGAARLVQFCRAAGLKVLLVSSGFSFFTDRIRERLGIEFARANVLEIRSGANCGELTGRLEHQPWGDLCDGAQKRRALLETCRALDVPPAQAIAVGHYAEDLPMLAEAGLSVAWHAQPQVRAQAMVAIGTGAPDRLLELMA